MNREDNKLTLGIRNEAFFAKQKTADEDRSNPVHYRIAQAQLSGHLDLSDLSLTALPEELEVYYKRAFAKIPVSQIALLERIDASNNQIERLPDFTSLGPIKAVNFSRNKISSVAAWSTNEIVDVNLSHNELESFDFSNLNAQKTLSVDLQGNRLQYVDTAGCRSFSKLNVAHNCLNELNISDLSIVKLDASHNRIRCVDSNELTQCGSIDLSFNMLSSLPCLADMQRLKSLNIAYNQITMLPDLPDSLATLTANNNKITELTGRNKLPKGLQVAIFDENEIRVIDDRIDELIPKITRLSLSNCDLTSLPARLALCEDLIMLKTDNNYIMTIPSRYLASSTRDLLAFLKQRLEPEVEDKLTVERVFKDGVLNLANMELTEVPVHLIDALNAPVTRIDISKNRITDLSPLHDLLASQSLQSVDLSYNPVKELPAALTQNEHVRIIQATNCGIRSVTMGAKRLQKLNLARNRITEIPAEIESCNYLTELDLSDNCISGALSESLLALPALEILNLKNNDITFVPYTYGNSKLKILSLYGNLIRSIPQEFITSSTPELLAFLRNRMN